MKNKIFTIPNIISFFRILLIPFMVWAFVLGEYYIMAALVIVSALSDIIDGKIARHYNMVSSLGKALDPIADKLTIFTLLMCMCFYIKSVPIIILLSIFVVKEFIMGIEGLIVIKKTGTTYSANVLGKITTVMLYINMLVHIVWQGINLMVSDILIIVSILFVCASLAVYTKENIRRIKSGKPEA